ncbi:LOW QUALITY PROTEIN: S-acyl fatty acid synthase thioesterase, medium chain-like [Pocillopora verrucosa]|uniref:LOW QUALITY PROTEIN: S-acyl fatty acid synthase thioesterase, medium chain-like n=1 Tax=Pocillopora verrucosa TaxID=203993 RepID=UPI00333FCC0F
MNSKWLRCVYQKQNAKLRLICFPWAGGGAAFYANWGKKFASEVEVHSCLPGRESRFKESFIVDDWESFLSDFCEDVLEILKGKPFAFWGHSLGARLCFEAAKYLKLYYNSQPVHLLISSATAPQVAKITLDVSTQTDDDLIKKISSWGGTPKVLTESKDMMKIAARVLRADLTLLQNYRFEESANGVVLDCPLTCFDGSDDLHDQDGWAELTSGSFKRHVLPGGHFYFMEGGNELSLTNHISDALRLHYTPSP